VSMDATIGVILSAAIPVNVPAGSPVPG